jgi:hypothetical protein
VIQLLKSGYDIRTVQELLSHKDVKTTMIYTPSYSTEEVMAPRVPWAICRGESHVCYTETIYLPIPSVADSLMACNHKAYADSSVRMICCNLAAQRYYEETI